MSSKKIVEQWVAKYGNNPEVDKIVNERVKYMTNNKSMTAVEWLREKLFREFGFAFSDNIFEQAKEMEKEQIIKTAIDASSHKFEDVAEKYYNDTYGKDKSNN